MMIPYTTPRALPEKEGRPHACVCACTPDTCAVHVQYMAPQVHGFHEGPCPPTHQPGSPPFLRKPCFKLKMAALRRHQLVGPTPGLPYYRRQNHTDQSLMQGMPTQLLRAFVPGTGVTDAWKPMERLSVQDAVSGTLDFIGSILRRIARLSAALPPVVPNAVPGPDVLLSGHEAFEQPLGLVPQLDLCMLPDAQAVRSTRHIAFDQRGYLLVKVGRRPKSRGGWLAERAHRIILWAIWGPPPAGMIRPVCMHVCNQPSCLNPDHVCWGEDGENKSDAAGLFGRQRLTSQGRFSFP